MPPKKNKGKGRATSSLDQDYQAVKRFVKRTAGPFALAAWKGASSLMNVEVKHSDGTWSTAVSSTTSLHLMTGVAQGDGNTTRDGNSIKLMGGRVSIVYQMNASATASVVRTMIVVDTRNAGSDPTSSHIFDDTTVIGLPNLDTAPNRFQIMYDSCTNLSINGDRSKTLDIECPWLANLHIMYNGTGGTIASINGPAVYVVTLSNEATNTVTRRMETRVFFVDN